MSMRHWSWRRRLLTALGMFGALVLVAAIAVPLLVPSERWKSLAFEQLEKHTQLVGSAESASVSLFPLGLKLGGLRIEDPQGVTNLENLRFDLESAVVRASLGSILRGAPEVKEVRLVKPRLEFGLPDPEATAALGDTAATAPAVESDAVLLLAMLSIEDGQVIVHDTEGARIEIGGLQNRASLRTAAGRSSGEMRGEFEHCTVTSDSLPAPLVLPPLHWQLAVQMQLDGSSGTAEVERLEIAGMNSVGTVGWTMGPDAQPALDVDLDLSVDLVQMWKEMLRDQIAATPLPAPWTVDDFEILGGEAVLALTMQGAIPATDPDDPSAMLRPLRASGNVRGLRMRTLDRTDLVNVSSRVELEDAVLRFDDLQLEGALGTMQAAMSVALSLTEPLRGRASADLDLAALRSLGEQWWPRFAALAEEEAAGPEEWPQLGGRVQAEANFEIAADGSFDASTAPASAVTWTARSEQIVVRMPTMTVDVLVRDARIQGDLQNANVEAARFEGPGLSGDAVLQLSGWPESTVVRGEVIASRLDLDALQAAMLPDTDTAWVAPGFVAPPSFDRMFGVGIANAQATKSELPPPPPENLDVDVQLRAQEVTSAGYTLREVRGNARLVDQQLDVQDISGRLGTGSIDGTAGVDWTVEPPAWNSDLRATDVSAAALLEPVAGSLAQTLTTQFSGEVRLDGPMALEPAQIVMALTGAIAMRSTQGSFAAESLLGPTVSKFLGDAAAQWRSIDFSALTANMSLSGGRVHFDRVFLNGTTELQATGSVGLDGTPAYRLDVRLPRGITPDLGALQPVADLLRDDDGRINFGVNVSGEAKRPTVEIDLADLQRRAQRSGEDRLRSELRDRIGGTDARDKLDEALGGKLDQLLGGATRKPATADSAGAAVGDSNVVDPRSELEDKAEDAAGSLLDRLKGRKKGGGGDD